MQKDVSSIQAKGVYAALATPRRPDSTEADTAAYLDYLDKVSAAGVDDYRLLFPAGFAPPQVIEAQVGNDAVDPGIEGTFEAEICQVAIGLEEGFLVDVLGILLRPCQAERKPQNWLVVLAHQGFEGGPRAFLRFADQLGLGGPTPCFASHV